MADNLTISIGADTSKARVDLKLLQQELKNVNREIDAAIKAGDIAQANQLSAAYGNIEKQSIALKNSLRAQRTETDRANDSLKEFVHSGRGIGRVLSEFSTLTRGTESLGAMIGVVTGGFAGGLLGAAIFKGLGALNEQLNAVSENIKKINEEANKTGQKPINVQAMQELAQGKGLPAEAGSGFMAAVAEAAAKAQTAGKELSGTVQVMRGTMGDFADGVKVLRGSMTEAGNATEKTGSQIKNGMTILRGSSPLVLDVTKVYDQLGVNMKNVTGAGDSLLKKQKEVAEAFIAQQKSFNPLQLNEMAKALKFASSDEALKLLPGRIADIDAKIQELNNSARGATKERIEALEAMNAAMNRVKTIFTEGKASFNDWRVSVNTSFNNTLADFLEKTLPEWFANTKKAFADFWPQLAKDFADSVALWTNALPDFQPWIDKTISAIKAVGSAIGSASAAGAGPFLGPGGFAGGGMIRGPGTGTSDSILARLSNGEFVMRASAVRAWGADFMRSINSFSDGGLVRPIPRFAGGGMVTATTSDGVTVVLQFPGGSFALRGDAAIVGGLTREARRAGMLSAGRLAGALA